MATPTNQDVRSPRPQPIQATFTRPANTTAYADGDAITDSASAPTIITFSDCAQIIGGGGTIVAATLITSNGTTTNFDVRLILSHGTLTPTNDNAAADVSAAQAKDLFGSIKFASADARGLTSSKIVSAMAADLPLPFVCAAASKDLSGELVADGAYTPASGEVFDVILWVIQD